jgi:SSS family solute:Na+ symporter
VIGVATAPLSSLFPGIYVAIQTFLSFFQGPLFAILLLGIFWKRTTQWGGLSGLVIGIAFAFYLNLFSESIFTIEDPFLYVSWWSFVLAFIVTIIVTFFTESYSAEKLDGLVYKVHKAESK